MFCPNCGKKLPENAVNCKKCGLEIRQILKNTEAEDFFKKEKEKADMKAQKLKEKSKGGKSDSVKKIIIICAAVLALAAVIVGILFMTGVLNPSKKRKTTRPADETQIEYTFKDVSADEAFLSFGDINISKAEYEFFFRQSYSNTQNAARLSFQDFAREKVGDSYDESKITDYYSEYAEEFFKKNPHTFDFTKPINNQPTTALNEEEKDISWQEYIRNDAITTLKNYRIKFQLAIDSGMEVTDDIKYQVYTHIEGLREAVTNGGGGTLKSYLQMLFGENCDEEFFKNELIREYMASKYDTASLMGKIDSYSDDEVKKAYESNSAKYDYADIYVFEVTEEIAKKAGKGAKEVAEAIYKNTKNLDGFTSAIQKEIDITSDKTPLPAVPGNYLSQTYSEDMAAWVYDKARKADEVNMFKTANGYTVVVIQVPAYTKKDSITYREIVLNKTDSEGKPLSEEKLKELETTANEILKECSKKKATEDTFAYYALTKSNAQTATAGGLVECTPAEEMTDEIKEWATGSRNPGDVDMFETDDAYTILRFGCNYGDYWNYAVRSEKASEETEESFKKAKDEKYATNYEKSEVEKFEGSLIASINKIYLGIGA
ncbi:MAG: peptidylprolyl isomerase [Clostridia bacterium]|nr:peptidylprolyl isomerase [Clostridia bacterium]